MRMHTSPAVRGGVVLSDSNSVSERASNAQQTPIDRPNHHPFLGERVNERGDEQQTHARTRVRTHTHKRTYRIRSV